MNPREFLQRVVKPNLEALTENPLSFRHMYNAVLSVDALAAHVFSWWEKHSPQETDGSSDLLYRKESGKTRSDVRLLHEIAKAAKHVELTRGTPSIKAISEVRPRSFGYGEGGYGVGPYGGGTQISVIVDDTKIQITSVLTSTIVFYEQEMDRLGIPKVNDDG